MKSKILSILVSLGVAFGLWAYVITVVNPESEANYYDVPVVFDGLSQLDSRDLMVVSGTSVSVDLRLLGNRTDLNKLDKTNITILADLSRITEPGEYSVKYSISYPSSAGTIEVLNQEPQSIKIQVSRRITKEIPVKLNTTNSMPENYTADEGSAVLSHKMVTVTGPEEVISQIHHAAIAVELNSKQDLINQTCRHTLCDEAGKPIEDVSAVTVNVSDIDVTIKVWQIKELPLVILVEEGGGLTEEMVELLPEFDTILVSGSPSTMEKHNYIPIGPVKLGELTEDTEELTLNIMMEQGLTNESGLYELTVKVKMPEMQTKTFIILNINVINVPDGLVAKVLANTLQVEIRGPVDLMKQLNGGMIVATVDCSGQTLRPNAANRLRVTITIPEMEGVNPVMDYWVYVQVSEEGVVPEA